MSDSEFVLWVLGGQPLAQYCSFPDARMRYITKPKAYISALMMNTSLHSSLYVFK